MIAWTILFNHVYFHAIALELQPHLIKPHVKRIGKCVIALTLVFYRFLRNKKLRNYRLSI